jgi:hypothetical protein
MNDKQFLWEFWFIASIILEIVVVFTGMMENSVAMFPNWDVFAGLFTINLIYCVYIGNKTC